jgi:hypothetical protein
MSNQPQVVYVKQKGGFSTGCMIGLGIIFALVLVFVIVPAGCTILVGGAALNEVSKEVKRQEAEKAKEVTPVAPVAPVTPESKPEPEPEVIVPKILQTLDGVQLPITVISNRIVMLADANGKETIIKANKRIKIFERRSGGLIRAEIDGAIYDGDENRLISNVTIAVD